MADTAHIYLLPCIYLILIFKPCTTTGSALKLTAPPEICTAECLKRVSMDSNNVGGGESCGRGCRFFTIAQLIGDREIKGKPYKSEACKAMCQESYTEGSFELNSCKTGCESNLQFPISEYSWSWFIDNGNSMQILQGEIPEPDDVLTDPSLRSQISRVETLRIPEIRLRTMPVLQEKTNLCGGSVKGVPHCLVWSLLLLLTLLGLMMWLSSEEPKDDPILDAPPLPEKPPLVLIF